MDEWELICGKLKTTFKTFLFSLRTVLNKKTKKSVGVAGRTGAGEGAV